MRRTWIVCGAVAVAAAALGVGGPALAASPAGAGEAGDVWLAWPVVQAADLAASALCAEEPAGLAHETWLAAGEAMAGSAAGEAAASRPFIPYAERIGPAYPGDFWRSFGRDGKEFLPMLWDDTKATVTNPVSLVFLGLAAGGVALFENNGDDQVENHFRKHGSQLNTFWDTVGDAGGNPGTHFALAGGMYFLSLARGDTRTYEVSKTMLSALAINGITTLALKAALRTESPNGDENGWPSGHTSSSFALATVLYESYGPWVGIPALGFAAFVGYERIDARNHDFSDVVSGALLGIAIGHAVSQNHKPKFLGMDVIPYADPRGGVGLALAKQW
jgi:hypothetical protein